MEFSVTNKHEGLFSNPPFWVFVVQQSGSAEKKGKSNFNRGSNLKKVGFILTETYSMGIIPPLFQHLIPDLSGDFGKAILLGGALDSSQYSVDTHRLRSENGTNFSSVLRLLFLKLDFLCFFFTFTVYPAYPGKKNPTNLFLKSWSSLDNHKIT